MKIGLVIKAKSMFDEPIRIGLIRFADLYDHENGNQNKDLQDRHNSEQLEEVPWNKESAMDFDSSHQPILVIYTTIANESLH